MKDGIRNRVHEMRKQTRMTQETLAQAIGVTRQTIIAIEKGNYVPSLVLAMKLAQHFKKKVDDLFSLI